MARTVFCANALVPAKLQALGLQNRLHMLVQLLQSGSNGDIPEELIRIGIQDLIALVRFAAVFGDHGLL